MKKTFKNVESISGRVYQHDLVKKTVQNKESKNFGKEFISGTVDIAIDEEGLNVIPIHYTYVTEFTSNNNKNATYGVLNSIIEGAKTWITDGKEAALKVRANTALALNDFYNNNNEFVSAKRNEGGFLNTINELPPEAERGVFGFDIVITSAVRVVPEEDDAEDFVRIKGAIFDFRKALLPVELVCRDQNGMDYFESIEASPSNPIFTEVRGNVVSNTIKKEIEEESAFGTASVRTVTRTVREWQVTWAKPTEYVFGEEDTLTSEELKKMMQDRELYLAEVKKRALDYRKSRAEGTTSNTTSTIPAGGFNF